MAERYEVIPTPGPADTLQVNDEVWLLFKLMQGGHWFVAYQIEKLDKYIEEDGRFRIFAWQYDREGQRVRFKIRVRDPMYPAPYNPDVEYQLQRAGIGSAAGYVCVAMISAIIGAILYATVYSDPKIEKVFRVVQEVQQSDLPEPVKADLIEQAIDEGQEPSVTEAVTETAQSIGGALMWLALAVVALAWLGTKR